MIADRYELVRRIGRGGMGAVYEARHRQTRRRCAVKLLNRLELSGDAEVVKRFFREARASGSIESENVVAAYDSGIDAANRLYYVMEYLHGEDLAHTLDRVGPLTPATTVKILVQAAAGIARAHASGVIHRDLKPANLFLAVGADDEITVKILDFGVAKVRQELFGESSNSLTRGGALLGTPEYMSPEQLKHAASIDESTDVWSLGVVLFECLTGSLPWGNAESIGEMLAAVLTSPVPPVQDLAPWVPAGLAKIAHDGLHRDVAKRTRTADVFRTSLAEQVAGDLRLRVQDLAGPTEAERRVHAERLGLADTLGVGMASDTPVTVRGGGTERRPLTPLAYALGALALGTVGALLLQRGSTAAPTLAREATRAASAPAPPPSSATLPALVPEPLRFALEVEPPVAAVTIDGVPVTVRDGHVPIAGWVGSIHDVRASYQDRADAQKITITLEGPVPARLVLPPRNSKRASDGVKAAPSAAPSAPPPPVASSRVSELSQAFE